jgi:hypothetical protein
MEQNNRELVLKPETTTYRLSKGFRRNKLDMSRNADFSTSYTLQTLTQEHWHHILDDFEDASIYQTASFCSSRAGAQTGEHLVVTNRGNIVSAAQVRMISLPFVGNSIAYVLAGPLCRRRKSEPDWDAFRQALRALRIEYVARRKMSLRINPLFTLDQGYECLPLFRAEGYTYVLPPKSNRTIIVDLERPLDELRKGLDQKWRNCLNQAERNGLQIIEGIDDATLDLFLHIYHEMLARKRLPEPGDIRTLRALQAMLPERYKMNVIVILDNGRPTAGAVISAIGRKGIYLFGATADNGMKNKAAYLAQWRAIQWLKEMDCAEYDLNGVNAESNPGVSHFKTGLCGRNGKEIDLIGYFEAHAGIRSRVVLAAADLVNSQYKRLKAVCARYRGFRE